MYILNRRRRSVMKKFHWPKAGLAVLLAALAAGAGDPAAAEEKAAAPELPAIVADLQAAPAVPPPTRRDYPAKVIVNLEAREYRAEIAKGSEYEYWGYNGLVPGPFVRVREGDVIE